MGSLTMLSRLRGEHAPREREREASERLAAVAAASRSGLPAAEAWREWGEEVQGVGPVGELAWREGPGAADGSAVAACAAQRLAHAAGVPLADVLEALARLEVAAEEARLAQSVALAGPRSSSRVLTWLPAVGLALAVIVEPGTLGLLVTTTFGWALLALGAGLWWAGRTWTARLVRVASAEAPRDLITWCALLAASTRSGLDLLSSLDAVSAATGRPLHHVVARVRGGSQWTQSWEGCGDDLLPLAAALRPAWERGTSPVAALDALAASELARRKADALSSAAALGVRLTLPLSLCLLPAFIVAGVIPLVVAVGAGVVSEVAPALASLQPSGPAGLGDLQGGTP